MSRYERHGRFSAAELPRVAWHVSSRSSNAGGNCVEAGPLGDGSGRIAARHSHHPNGPTLVYTRDEWTAFVAGVKNGELDFTG